MTNNTPAPADRLSCEAAFLLALAEHGVASAVGEILIQGDGRHCGPGALAKAIAAYDRARHSFAPADMVEAVRDALKSRFLAIVYPNVNQHWDDMAQAAITAMQAYMASELAKPMGLHIALDFADNPRPYHTLQAPADTNGELYRALVVLADAYRRAAAIGKEHPDLAGHIADALRDACAPILGRIITFDQSEAIADAVLKAARHHNATYAAAITSQPDPAVIELIEMLESTDRHEGCPVFDHTPEEIGLHVMENHEAILAALKGTGHE